jgi:hypothetical protein
LETCFVQTATIPRNVDKMTTLLFPKLKPLNNILGHGGVNTVSTNEDDIIKIGTRLLYIATRLDPATWCLYTKDWPTRLFRVNNCIQPTATTLHNVIIHNVFHGRFSFQIKTIKASRGTLQCNLDVSVPYILYVCISCSSTTYSAYCTVASMY